MTLDKELFKKLGWSDDLLRAAEQVLSTVPEPISSPVDAESLTMQRTTTSSDAIDVGSTPPVGLADLIVR